MRAAVASGPALSVALAKTSPQIGMSAPECDAPGERPSIILNTLSSGKMSLFRFATLCEIGGTLRERLRDHAIALGRGAVARGAIRLEVGRAREAGGGHREVLGSNDRRQR